MADMITKNMIAWKGETPWHGKGFQVNPDATGEEMAKVAKIDFHVQWRALAMRNANYRADFQGDMAPEMLTSQLAGFKAIVRADTDEVFQIATNRYHVVQPLQVVNLFKEYCEAGNATMETVGGLKGGKIIWALAKLNGVTHTNIKGNDEMMGYLLMATSFDGSVRTIAKATSVRVVCWNTLSAAFGEDSKHEFAMKHSAKWTLDKENKVKETLGIATSQIAKTHSLANELSKIQIDQQGRIQFINMLLKVKEGVSLVDQIADAHEPKSLLSQMVEEEEDMSRIGKAILDAMITSPGSDLPSAKDTLWGAVNGVTYYVDHERGKNQDNRLANAWFGTGEKMKEQAMEIAMEMGGVKVN